MTQAARTGLALAVAALGAFVLIAGWGSGAEPVLRVRPGFVAMVPGTALLFLILGGGLALHFRRRPVRRDPALMTAALAALAITLANVVPLAVPGAPWTDRLIAARPPAAERMSYLAAFNFVLASGAALMLAAPGGYRPRLYSMLATLGLFTSLVATLGYAFDAAALYGEVLVGPIALHTAAGFLALFPALLLARAGDNWSGLLLADGAGSAAARRMFPVVVLAPLAVAYGLFMLTEAGVMSSDFRLSLVAILTVAITTAGVVRNARIENLSEARLQRSLQDLARSDADKALLLRELHHRVKNNLQQIAAMLRIESRRRNDPRLGESYGAMVERIRALSLVHQMLIASPSMSEVNACDFLARLVAAIAEGHDLGARGIAAGFETDAQDEMLHLETVVSIGLLVNELVVNAARHAFPDGRKGRIRVRYSRNPQMVELSVCDDGIGCPAGAARTGTGSTIVDNLVAQLRGELTIPDGPGTMVVVRMPANLNENARYE